MPLHDIKCRYCSNIDTKFIDISKKEFLQCDRCDGWDVYIYYGNFKPNTICGTARYSCAGNGEVPITAKEIDDKCKSEGLVYGTPQELEREASKHRYRNELADKKKNRKLAEEIVSEAIQRGE